MLMEFILFTHFCYKAPPAAAAKTFDLVDFVNGKVESSAEDFHYAREIVKRNPQSPVAKKARKYAKDELDKWTELEDELSEEKK